LIEPSLRGTIVSVEAHGTRSLVKNRIPMQMLQIALLLFTLPIAASAAEVRPTHRLMFFEYGNCPNRFVQLDAQGRIVRQFKPRSIAVMFQLLPNGNLVYGYGGNPTGVVEVNPRGETVWNYVSKSHQVLGCERLPNGNTLVAEQGPCRVLEVNPDGQTVHATNLTTNQTVFHLQVRNVHKLMNGNILAAHEGEGAIREYEPDGKIAWEYTGVTNTGEGLRLANGNTLIAGATQKRLIEVTPDKKIVWEFTADDAPELNLTWVSSLQILKNGNYLVGNFLRGQEGKGAHAFEVTRSKQVVWTFTDHKQFRSVTTVRAIDDY
jgi:hypothetical protein